MVRIDRRRYCHDEKFRFLQFLLVCSEVYGAGFDCLIAHFVGGIYAFFVFFNLLCVQIEANDIHLFGKSYGNGHPHIAQAYQCQLFLFVYKLFI